MPEAMTFDDLRTGTDLEFGQSIYEPFGIAQLEPLSAGALSVVFSICGCIGFVSAARVELDEDLEDDTHNLLVADYVSLPPNEPLWSAWDALRIDSSIRNNLEGYNSYSVAQEIARRLPANESETRRLLERGQQVAQQMSWETVARNYFLPALRRT